MEPIEVSARFDSRGKAFPLMFTWQEQTYQVDSLGRRWDDEQGQHILVMIPGGRVFELLYAPLEGHWYMARAAPGRAFA
jgi:hypothetical protein